MKKAIIFDFDGVIVDSEPVRYKTYRRLFRNNYSVELPEKMDNKLIGRAQKENMAYFLATYNLEGDVEELIRQRSVLLKEVFSKKENIKPLPGLLKLLKMLKKHKCKVVIASSSSKEYILGVLKLTGLLNFFDLIVSGEMVSKSKPDPEIFIITSKKLGVRVEDYIVVEDSVNGIIAAKSAGMKTVAITSSFDKEQLRQADIVVDRLDKINISDIM